MIRMIRRKPRPKPRMEICASCSGEAQGKLGMQGAIWMTRMIRMKPRPKPRMEISGRCHQTSAEFWICFPLMTGNIRMIRRKPRPEPRMENPRSRNITNDFGLDRWRVIS